MRYSRYFLHTSKEAPADAEVTSHKLMLRAGMIRKVAAGIYTYLPYGIRALRKFEAIVRDEMNRAGAQELLMPAVQPAEVWEESGRWQVYGKELLRFKDRHERDFCFGPTHEEVITMTVRQEVRSYRDLPLNLYQIQTKFRDEVRPRFGLMRGREFLMKDAYSFDRDQEGAHGSYWLMVETYKRIFQRCGLKFRTVEAMTGKIGGTLSHEFQVLADSGEDLIASCGSCDYAANIEKAEGGRESAPVEAAALKGELKEVHTPGKRTVEEVATFLQVKPHDLIKTLIYWSPSGLLAACVRGDDEVNESKLMSLAGHDEIRLANAEETRGVSKAEPGFTGPRGLSCPVYLDRSLDPARSYVSGANRTDYHTLGVRLSDVKAAGTGDLRLVKVGDKCPRCEGRLQTHRGIEVGQVFYLGTKYSHAMGALYLDEKGAKTEIEMGCYGIGIGRTVAAAIEQSHDEKGIIFPMALAPFQVVLVTLAGKADQDVTAASEKLYEEFKTKGIEVLWDERDERAGVKFNDAELLGIPLQLVIGKKSLSENVVEVKERATGEVRKIPLAEGVQEVAKIIRTHLQESI